MTNFETQQQNLHSARSAVYNAKYAKYKINTVDSEGDDLSDYAKNKALFEAMIAAGEADSFRHARDIVGLSVLNRALDIANGGAK